MKILLVNTDLPERQISKTLPLSMYFIGGLLRKNGYDIDIVDPMLYRNRHFNESIYDVILEKSRATNIICFSANSFSFGYMLKIIANLRENDYKGTIIMGGVHPTHYPNNVIGTGLVDYVIIGEAELTLPKLINNIIEGSYEQITNVISKENSGVLNKDLANIQQTTEEEYIYPAYDLVPRSAYNSITIEASRGCYGNCSFCSIPNKVCWRGFPIDYIIKNIEKAIPIVEDRFNHKSICFTDDCFTADIKRAENLLNIFSTMPIKDYYILIEARLAHLMNEDLIASIKKLPNISVQVGIECGYDVGLKRIRKGITREQILKNSKYFYEKGISKSLFYSFIIGFPWETYDNCMKTLELMSFLKNTYGIIVNCSWWLPVPSLDFDELKLENSNITNEIFEKNGWINSKKIFNNCRPLLNEDEIYILTKKIANEGLTFDN